MNSQQGILGLNCNTSSSSYVTQLYKQGIIPEHKFGFFIGTEKQQSEIVFGGYNDDLISNEISYFDVIPNPLDWWNVNITRFSYNGKNLIT
jgi:hypothetical protein